jgi:hypothetical protein
VNQLGAGRGCVLGEIVFLTEHYIQTATGSIPCNAGTVDTAANNQNIRYLKRFDFIVLYSHSGRDLMVWENYFTPI